MQRRRRRNRRRRRHLSGNGQAYRTGQPARGFRPPVVLVPSRSIPRFRDSVCPDAVQVTLHYTKKVDLGGPSLTVDTYSFRCNSIYDPDFTGGGSPDQPTGYDEWAFFYRRYSVQACKITCQVSSPTQQTHMLTVYPSNNDTTGLTGVEGSEQPYAKTIQLSTSTDQKNVSVYLPIQEFLPYDFNNSTNTASMSANPAQPVYFHCTGENLTSADCDLVCLFKLTFYVTLHTRQELDIS